jgi:glyceraldehyde-3-phosphate dehydrogenase (NADP+)
VQVVRSADLVSYAAEEGIRILAAGRFIVPDCFPGNGRNKLCMASKVHINVM